MTTGIVFVHGINVGAQERANLARKMQERMMRYENADPANPRHIPAAFSAVAPWNSSGDFLRDLVELVGPKWEAARDMVRAEIAAQLEHCDRMLVVAHSMGQPLAVEAMAGLLSKAKIALLTVGGPMGCPWWRPYLDVHMPGQRWGRGVGSTVWWDVWNPDDPVCGKSHYESFLAAKPIQIDVPGHPGLLTPLAEHSSYFDQPAFWDLVLNMVLNLEASC